MRRPSDVNGLSVNIAARCTPEECVAGFSRTYGVWTLHVGRIRNIGLDVIQDGPSHANIVGVPYEHEDQRGALQQFAATQNPMAWALAAWMRQRRTERPELRLSLLDKILHFVQNEPYRRLLIDAVRTYFRLNRAEQAEEHRLLQSTYGEVDEMLNTELGRLEARARREGREEAMTELGRREEAAERRAVQIALLEFLESRFGALPATLETQVGRVQDTDSLKSLIRRAATVASPEEMEPLLKQ